MGPANVSGSIAALVSFGADGPGDNGFSLSSDLDGLYEPELESKGDALSYVVDGDMLYAYVPSEGDGENDTSDIDRGIRRKAIPRTMDVWYLRCN